MRDKLFSAVSHDFPEHDITHVFEAALPIYFARLIVEVLAPQHLNNFEIYFLHALSQQVNTREEIAQLLGLDDRDLITPGADLLKQDLIRQGAPDASGKRPIFLTDAGRATVTSQKVPPTPMRTTVQVHFNAMTWVPVPLEVDTWAIEQMEQEGLCVLPPTRQERPTLGDFTIRDVALAVKHIQFFQENRLIKLLELKKKQIEYVAPVTVVALRDHARQEQRFAIYRGEVLQRGESAVLQRHFETGHFFLPGDAVALDSSLEIPATLPKAVASVAQHLSTTASSVRRLQETLADAETLLSRTIDRNERKKLLDRIDQLEEEIHRSQQESDQLRQQLQQNQGTFLRTEEHREVLERALKDAKSEVIIISPWLNRRTCDEALCNLVAQAVKRNVRIRIGYGITERPGDGDVGRHRNNARRVISALKSAVGRVASAEQFALLDVQRTSDTHEKILVCDRIFAVLGSFNWLSYRGELDREYRREASILLRDPVSVAELARIALREWPQ